MSSRRTLILVGSIVVGAIAAFLILRYVNGVQDKADADNQMVPVVVVNGTVNQGDSADTLIQAGTLALGNRRRADLPANAVYRPEDVKGEVAAINMVAGEVVTTSKFVASTDSAASHTSVLDKGMVAVTVAADGVHSVAGLVQPGDYVNILVNSKPSAAQIAADPALSSASGEATLFQKVKVLAIGTDLGSPVAASGGTTATTAPPATSNMVTLMVPPEASGILAAASDQGLRLVLVRPDYQPRPLSPSLLSPNGDLPGVSGATPYDGLPSVASTTGSGQ